MNIPNSCKQRNTSTSVIWLTMLNSAFNSRKIQQLHLVIIYESNCIHKKLKVMWKKSFLMSLSYFRYLLYKGMCRCSPEELLNWILISSPSLSAAVGGGGGGKPGCISWSFLTIWDSAVCAGAFNTFREHRHEISAWLVPHLFCALEMVYMLYAKPFWLSSAFLAV